jgi:hypothetical protein
MIMQEEGMSLKILLRLLGETSQGSERDGPCSEWTEEKG